MFIRYAEFNGFIFLFYNTFSATRNVLRRRLSIVKKKSPFEVYLVEVKQNKQIGNNLTLKNSNHIIEKVRVEVDTSKLETAHSIRNNIDVFLKDELFPRLETLFNEYEFHDEIVRFDELTLNLSVREGHDFSQLPDEIYRQLKEKIDLQMPSQKELKNDPSESPEAEKQKAQRISAAQNSENVFLFFLENGHLPWYGKEEQISSFADPETWEKTLDNRIFFRSLDQILGTSETAADRFILQFPDEMVTAYLRRKNLRIYAETSAVLRISQNLVKDSRRIFLKLLIRLAHDDFPGVSKKLDRLIFGFFRADSPASKRMELEQLKTLLLRILPETSLQDSVLEKIDRLIEGEPLIPNEVHQLQDTKPEPFFEKEDNQIGVQNAGLILLHPFLKPFFTATGIIGKQGNLLPENFDLAVQALYFLATGNENAFEGNLVFEKFLCGVPLKIPIQKQSLLTDRIKNEANELLIEVVRYWPALKNTSADGLRQLFIQRDGKLFQEDTKYRLIVERKAQDVLLEKLNWNISVIKLPWISNILFTEW
jgi:hypothetical protein